MTATTRAGEWGGREMDGETVGTIVNAIANIAINAVECVGIDHARGSLQKTEQHLVSRTKMFLFRGGHSLCSPLGNDKNQGPLILVFFSLLLSFLSLLLLYFFGYHSKTQGCFAHNYFQSCATSPIFIHTTS